MTPTINFQNTLHNRYVTMNTIMSQGSSAANTVSAFHPQAKHAYQVTQNISHANFFASLTQSYKDSYEKFIKEKGNDSNLNFKSIFNLNKILEDEQFGHKQKDQSSESENIYKLDFVA
ncbi:MAG: hypothetical protein AB1782_03890 [Cyanobacteriota bacterium]